MEKKLEGELHENAEIIVEEVTRLEHILKEILAFVKGSKLTKEKINLNDLIDNIAQLIRPEIEEKGNRFIINPSESPIMTKIDSDRIKEALLNIIKNANQATESGTIIVKTGREGTEALVEISDTGCGIKQEELKHIFTPFFTTLSHGTGLGLAITNRIIQEHNGRIEVESVHLESGRDSAGKKGGTTFRICLPLDEP